MSNRALAIGAVLALATAAIVTMMTHPAFGPRASLAEPGRATISIEQLHREVDPGKLPIHAVPDP